VRGVARKGHPYREWDHCRKPSRSAPKCAILGHTQVPWSQFIFVKGEPP